MTDNVEDLRRWRLPRGRHGLPRELVTRSQRERLLAAMVRVAAAKGYGATTVADILEHAGVGRESFYELFDDKRDCMLAAHSILVEDLEAKVRAACEEPGEWADRLQAALADEGLVVMTVSEDNAFERIESFYAEQKLTHLGSYLDEGGKLAQAYKVRSMPTTVVIDRDGQVVGRMQGPAEWDSEEAKALLRWYLARPEQPIKTSG